MVNLKHKFVKVKKINSRTPLKYDCLLHFSTVALQLANYICNTQETFASEFLVNREEKLHWYSITYYDVLVG